MAHLLIGVEASYRLYMSGHQKEDPAAKLKTYAATDFGTYKAGEKILVNAIDYKSDVRGITFTALPTPSFGYSQGRLFSLVDGGVSLTGASLSKVKATFKLKTAAIAFVMTSQSTYSAKSPAIRTRCSGLWQVHRLRYLE